MARRQGKASVLKAERLKYGWTRSEHDRIRWYHANKDIAPFWMHVLFGLA
jgi:hypothetical protein